MIFPESRWNIDHSDCAGRFDHQMLIAALMPVTALCHDW
jgi:hypothetical protein